MLFRYIVHLEGIDKDGQKAKYLWAALESFSNADRSQFIRFVTGRRRLPATITVVSGYSIVSFLELSPQVLFLFKMYSINFYLDFFLSLLEVLFFATFLFGALKSSCTLGLRGVTHATLS